jgi:hypothetical protein
LDIKNSVADLTAEYDGSSAKETIILSADGLKIKSVMQGTGYVLFLPPGRQVTPTDMGITLEDCVHGEYVQVGSEGHFRITLPPRFDSTGFLFESGAILQGAIRAPAVTVEREDGKIYYIFLFRSPTRSFQWLARKHELSVTDGSSSVNATVHEQDNGLNITVSISGRGYSLASLYMQRSFAPYLALLPLVGPRGAQLAAELLGEGSVGGATVAWRPERKDFDFISLIDSKMGWRAAREFLLPMGIDVGDLTHLRLPKQTYF